jgi:hypothetical protein
MRTRTTVFALIAAWSLLACGGPGASSPPGPTPIALRTQELVGSETPIGCPAALIEGVLVADAESGVALRDGEGLVEIVIWPYGFSGRVGDPIAVVDADGKIVARVGDRVRIGGGAIGPDGAWMACGGVEVL